MSDFENAMLVDAVHCSSCGTRVSGFDADLGLVVRAWVECPECLARPRCLLCGHHLASHEPSVEYDSADGHVIAVFCETCDDALVHAQRRRIGPIEP